MNDLLRLITLQDANTRTVLLGAGILGLACGVVGALATLRRRALIGDTLAHASLPGIAVAYFVIGDRHLYAFLLGALVFGLLGVWCVNLIRDHTRIKEDAALGLVLGSFFGLGIALSKIIQNQPAGNRAGLDGFLFGKAASMVQADVMLIAGVAACSLLLSAALIKEFRLIAFDPAFAASLGWPVKAIDLAMMALVALCTVAGLPAVGVVMVAALLIIPGVTARLWTDRFGPLLIIAGLVGLLSGTLGTALSAALPPPSGTLARGWPTGPLIVLVAAGAFALSLIVAPRRGLIARARRGLLTPPDPVHTHPSPAAAPTPTPTPGSHA
jgi:manganese/zinc/iron transport system permease protein